MPSVCIVGGQSQIGSALAATLATLGWSVTTTSRRTGDAVVPGSIHFDLSAPPAQWPQFPTMDAAVLCAAETRQQACEVDPVGSARVNLDHTVALAQKLSAAGAFVLLLSTVAVFDGTRAHYKNDDRTSPVNTYGRQKAASEEAVLSEGTAAVLRLSKVMGADMPLLKQWQSDLRSSNPITAFSDVTLAPVSISFVVTLIDKILKRREHRIYHASGDRDLPYADLATMMCQTLKAPLSLCAVRPSGTSATPKHTTLDMSLEHTLFGIKQPKSETAMREALESKVVE